MPWKSWGAYLVQSQQLLRCFRSIEEYLHLQQPPARSGLPVIVSYKMQNTV